MLQVMNVSFYSQYPEEQDVNLVPSWLGSQGISIFVHSRYPFSISWNRSEKRQFCILSHIMVPREFSDYEVSEKRAYLQGCG